MKFFADTADIDQIRDLADLGLLDGVTTNPSLVAGSGRDFLGLIKEICAIVPGPVSAEVAATDEAGMRREAEVLRAIADNVVIKLPLTLPGLKVCHALTAQGTRTNVTLCFSAAQAILAAKAGATYVSPFVGRLDDVGSRGVDLIAQIIEIYQNYPAFTTQVLVSSVRSPAHIVEAARLGAGVVTAPPAVLKQLAAHPLTDRGLAIFTEAWAKTGQKIA